MTQRSLFRVIITAVGVAMLLTTVAVASGGQAAKGPKKATIVATGKLELKPNRFFKESYRWSKGQTSIASGGTLTIKEKIGEAHTASLAKKSDLPKNARQAGACFEGGICGKIVESHGIPDNGPPANPVVDVGAPGYDQPGDSALLDPKQSLKVKVTAKKGTTLYLLCAFHTEMQAKIRVR